jgi:type IV secretory pathway TraG/TraD family ATPase VirD4
MTESPRSTGHGDHDFWSALAARYVAALLLAASEHALTTHEVATAVAQRVVPAWLTEVSDVVARDIAQGMAQLDGRTFDSIATTADVTLTPWLSPYRGLDVADVITRDGTVYLVAPRRDHATYESLFRGAVRAGLTAHERAGTSPLLLVLDEAASIAPLPDLDELAATASGLGVTLVTIFQDVSQITARFGERAATIVNNHRARMVIAGTSDPALSRLLPEVVGDDLATLRRLPARRARVISGSRPVATVWLRPWWKQRNLRARGVRARVEPWPSTTPAIPDW